MTDQLKSRVPPALPGAAASLSCHRLSVTDGSYYRDGFVAVPSSNMTRIAHGITQRAWSPCVWQGGVRRQENFLRAEFCALDFDGNSLPEFGYDAPLSLAQAIEIFADLEHVIAVTRNHQLPKDKEPACDRYRVVLRFEVPIEDLDTYRATMKHYIDKYGADTSCVDGARFFFPCREVVSVNIDGFPADVFPPRARAPEYCPEPGELSAFVIMALRTPIPTGEKNTACYRIAKDMFRAGFSADDVFVAITTSPTYASTKLSRDLEEEIRKTISSGIRSAREAYAKEKAERESRAGD